MSYSFSIKAATKEGAKFQVASKLKDTVQYCKEHAQDLQQAQDAAYAFIDLLMDDSTKQVMVTMHGSLSWIYKEGVPPEEVSITGSNININAHLAPLDKVE